MEWRCDHDICDCDLSNRKWSPKLENVFFTSFVCPQFRLVILICFIPFTGTINSINWPCTWPLFTVHTFSLSHVGDKSLKKLGNCFSIQFYFMFFFFYFARLEGPLLIAGKSDVRWSWNQYFNAMSSLDLWFETPVQFFFSDMFHFYFCTASSIGRAVNGIK